MARRQDSEAWRAFEEALRKVREPETQERKARERQRRPYPGRAAPRPDSDEQFSPMTGEEALRKLLGPDEDEGTEDAEDAPEEDRADS